jgi:hypothetical protein
MKYFDPTLHTSYEYIHFTGENINSPDLTRSYAQSYGNLALNKPNGLWLSITGINCWERYCLTNNYRLEKLKTEFQILLKPDANILVLNNYTAFIDFVKKYAVFPEGKTINLEKTMLNLSISWDKILSDYQGIAVPAVYPRVKDMGFWYDTWRAVWYTTSACIWDLQAVKKVEKLA